MALKNTDPKSTKAFLIICPCCQAQFGVCRSCYTGHKYCSDGCRDWGYRKNTKKANKKYSSSIEAKKDHCDRNRVYRQRLRNNQVIHINSVMDKPSDLRPDSLKTDPCRDACYICGREILFFQESVYEDLELQLFHSD